MKINDYKDRIRNKRKSIANTIGKKKTLKTMELKSESEGKLLGSPILQSKKTSAKQDSKSDSASTQLITKTKLVNFTKFVIVPLIIVLLGVRVFIIRTAERELYYSHEAFIQRDQIEVGSEGYGTVSSINVNVGDYVSTGDILYRYNNSALDNQIYELSEQRLDLFLKGVDEGNISINNFNRNVEFLVKAKGNGIVDDINITLGDYVTKEEPSMILKSLETFVNAKIKVPPNAIERIKPGLPVLVRLVSSKTVQGYIKNVYPKYDYDLNLLEIDIVIGGNELGQQELKDLFTGSPVEVVVKSSDSFTQYIREKVNNINLKIIRDFLTYEIQ